jgi:hypothetical protein
MRQEKNESIKSSTYRDFHIYFLILRLARRAAVALAAFALRAVICACVMDFPARALAASLESATA